VAIEEAESTAGVRFGQTRTLIRPDQCRPDGPPSVCSRVFLKFDDCRLQRHTVVDTRGIELEELIVWSRSRSLRRSVTERLGSKWSRRLGCGSNDARDSISRGPDSQAWPTSHRILPRI